MGFDGWYVVVALFAIFVIAIASIGLYFFGKDDADTRGKKSNKQAQRFLIAAIPVTVVVSVLAGVYIHRKDEWAIRTPIYKKF